MHICLVEARGIAAFTDDETFYTVRHTKLSNFASLQAQRRDSFIWGLWRGPEKSNSCQRIGSLEWFSSASRI